MRWRVYLNYIDKKIVLLQHLLFCILVFTIVLPDLHALLIIWRIQLFLILLGLFNDMLNEQTKTHFATSNK